MNSIELSQLIEKKLNLELNDLSKQFFSEDNKSTSRFFILDNVLPADLALKIFNNFPSKGTFNYRNTFRERKYTYKKLDTIVDPIVNEITNSFQMDNVIKVIESITDTKNLTSDASLYAGGISRMDIGHFLNPHIDNSHDAKRKRYRRFNLLYYVTPDICELDGGNLEVWNKEVKTPFKIVSMFNRLVVLETTKYSRHSVDKVLSDINRCCVSNYYFSEESPENNEYYHVTSFVGRPEEKIKRFYGVIDNFLRNNFSKITGISRKRNSIRTKKD